jgi:P27 family predicted phage terminase small subunit
MGRRPDPEYIRVLKGKKPRLSKEEQLAWATDLPLPPDWLTAEALVCWDRMAAELHHAGILFNISRDKLARYCQAYADYREVMLARKEMGPRKLVVTIKNEATLKQHASILKAANDIMSEFEGEYGLTPASATKIRRPTGAGGPTPREDMDKFLEDGKET